MADEKNFDRQMLSALGYKVNERRYRDIKDIALKFPVPQCQQSFQYYFAFIEGNGIRKTRSDEEVVYAGAEHKGNPKLPNITVLPNIECGLQFVLGSTFGHQHLQKQAGDKRRFQEIYEFQGYGAMLLRNEDSARLHILKPREKVLAGTDDNMTLFNLKHNPLVTLDYANPLMNKANKDLENSIGPLMIIEHSIHGGPPLYAINFQINEEYLKKGILECGECIRNCGYHFQDARMPFGIEHERCEFSESPFLISVLDYFPDINAHSLGGETLYRFLHDEKRGFREHFSRVGISLEFGSNIPHDLEREFSPPLLELALTKNKALLGELQIKQ